LLLTKKQLSIVINFLQDILASTRIHLFQGQTDSGLIHWPNHAMDTRLPKQEEEKEKQPIMPQCKELV